jgi:hypothetical protein
MSNITGLDVAQFLGDTTVDTVELADRHLPLVLEMVRTYTRGRGFTGGEPTPAVRAVVISATARLTANPDSIITLAVDDYSVRRTVFEGFSLIEKMTLDGFRRKTA